MAAPSQTKEEKEQFFTQLEHLGESSGSETASASEDEAVIAARIAARQTTTKPVSPLRLPSEVIVIEDSPIKPLLRDLRPSSPAVKKARDVKQPSNKVMKPDTKRQTQATKNVKSNAPRSDKPKRAPTRKSKAKDEIQLLPEHRRIFEGLKFFFIPNNTIAKPRRKRIEKSIERGANWATNYDDSVTHVIVDISFSADGIARAFPDKQIPEGANILKDTWLIDAFIYGYLSNETASRYRFHDLLKPIEEPKLPTTPEIAEPSRRPATRKRRVQEVEDTPPRHYPPRNCPAPPSDELRVLMDEMRNIPASHMSSEIDDNESLGSSVAETDTEEIVEEAHNLSPATPEENGGFQCMKSHDGTRNGPNAKTIEILQGMVSYYERTGDQWRALSYRKGIGALAKQETLIRTRDEAIKIQGIGTRLADKIEEIVATNKLQRLENTRNDPTDMALQLFMGVYDVGYKQASKWIAKGYRTLGDLLQHARLSPNQRIGIEHYDDFQQRIPRAEVEQHADIVRTAIEKIDSQLEITIGGSYRRGAANSGDIDCLVHKKDASLNEIRKLMTGSVIPCLESQGFLKAALATSDVKTTSKWHGASCLPDSKVWRRIDFLFVPWESLGAARLYFTGNDIFNRSMRLLARKKGMALNQNGLFEGVVRDSSGKKLTEGTLLAGHSEKDIFEKLGVPFRPPNERQC